jgi:hypothetical protein
MKTNSTILREVSYQLTNGNPLWGMLLANEYFTRDNPFRGAIVTKFKQRISSLSDISSDLVLELIEGKKRAELPEDLAGLIGQRAIKRSRSVVHASRLETLTPIGASRRSDIRLNSRLAVRARAYGTRRSFISAHLTARQNGVNAPFLAKHRDSEALPLFGNYFLP